MTDDNNEAGGRREKNSHSTIHGNVAVKFKPFPSEAQKLLPDEKQP